MQNLTYESAWERAISDKDRFLVEKAFGEVKLTDKPIQFTTLRVDRNYKNELLIMVLVHNITSEEITFHNKLIRYMQGEEIIGEHEFNLPSLSVPATTSMPWTFIFPTHNYASHSEPAAGHLELKP